MDSSGLQSFIAEAQRQLTAFANEASQQIRNAQAQVDAASRQACANLRDCTVINTSWSDCATSVVDSFSRCNTCNVRRRRWGGVGSWVQETIVEPVVKIWTTISGVAECAVDGAVCVGWGVYKTTRCVGGNIINTVAETACQTACNLAQGVLTEANKELSALQLAVKGGAWLANQLLSAAGNLFSLSSLSFGGTVSANFVAGTSVTIAAAGTLVGRSFDVSITINIGSLTAMVADFVTQKFKDLLNVFSG